MAAIELEPLPPREAVEFFRQKGYRMAFAWQDMPAQEHAAAFTVAKAMRLDVLKEIRGATDRAIAEGTTFQDFRRTLGPQLRDKGWWGKREMVDPVTGETVNAQLGSDARLRKIFDTNVSTAYSEGQSERIQRNIELFPYLRTCAARASTLACRTHPCRPRPACRRSLVASAHAGQGMGLQVRGAAADRAPGEPDGP